MVLLYWLEWSEKWGSVLPDDEDSLTFFCMWLVTARANTDHPIECLIAAFCLSRCNAPFHSETIEFDRKRHCTPRWFPTNPTGCVRVCCEHDKKERKTKQKSDFSRKTLETFLKQKSQHHSLHSCTSHTQPTRGNRHVVSLCGCLQIFSHLRCDLSKQTPSSDQNSRKQYFLTGKRKFWTSLQLRRDIEY